ncbi:LexA family transcriptional regulator [Paraburkholderia sp. BL23I1N1]|uniref:LexA family protein n=1 Tax=Paraburkholderia sp. BL23I1N1 TaxID=1938802 RepID=UPI000E760B48|nr:S24 family peptidase [Paraburkholderia sp. BL23I1N1]
MNERELARQRIEALRAAIDKLCGGNRTAFGKRLGYKDGAFVRQMLSGDRPVTEKTIRAIEALPGMKNWFSEATIGVPHHGAHASPAAAEHKVGASDAPNTGEKRGLITTVGKNTWSRMVKSAELDSQHQGTYPLISWAQARTWDSIVDNFAYGDAEQWLDSPVAVSQKSYYLRVRGESMYDPADHRSFREGEIVLVDPKGTPDHRKFIVVMVDGEAEPILRQLISEGERIYLKALNPAWPEGITEIQDNAVICGVVKTKIVTYD